MFDFSQLEIEDETPVRTSSVFSSGRNVYLSNDTIISHRGAILGTMEDVNSGIISDGTRCDCPAGHGKHTDGIGEDYAHIVKLSGGNNAISCSGSGCSGVLYVMDKPREGRKAPSCEVGGSDKHSEIIPQNAFAKYKLTKERMKELEHMRFVIDGLFVENYHTYLVGNAGAGKTTVLLHLCFEMVEKGYTVYYLYLDGALSTASTVAKEIERREVSDKYNLLVDGTMEDYQSILKQFIKQKADLRNTVFVLDTFKFLTTDIQQKNANKTAMHFIKEVNKLGATFISLGHTNKDGKTQSGTAEIEQDSDGLLRIDGLFNGFENITTIKRGGRCRFDVKEHTFSFSGGDVLSVKHCDAQIDIQAENERMEQEQKDSFFIDEAKRVLRLNPNIIQKDLISMVMDGAGLGRNVVMKKLQTYLDKHWTRTKSDNTAIAYRYCVKDKDYSY